MDVIDKFLNKIAFKFPKGYPDMNNDQDVLLLESLLSDLLDEKFIFEAPSKDIEDGIEILKTEYGLTDGDFKEVSGKTYKVLVPKKERKKYFDDSILKKIDFR